MATSEPLPEAAYQPKDAIGATIKATMITTGAGAFISTIQNTLTKQNVGAMGIFSRTGSTIAVFGESGAMFSERLCATMTCICLRRVRRHGRSL